MQYAHRALLAAALLSACTNPRADQPDRPIDLDDSSLSPGTYRARFETSRGVFVVSVIRAWSPRGADRFHLLIKRGFYQETRFFRVVPGFIIQWGIHRDPSVHAQWTGAQILDDPPIDQSNVKGTVAFATSGPNTRTTQVFINLADNERLDGRGFTPFGKVTEGMEIVEKLYSGYGDAPPKGQGPAQELITAQGNSYLAKNFPRLDYIQKAEVVP